MTTINQYTVDVIRYRASFDLAARGYLPERAAEFDLVLEREKRASYVAGYNDAIDAAGLGEAAKLKV